MTNPTPCPHPDPRSTPLVARIENTWLDRAKAQNLVRGSARYRRAEAEFFVGAITAIDAMDTSPRTKPDTLSPLVPIAWVIAVVSGDPIAGDSIA